jgi:hypothetical protein
MNCESSPVIVNNGDQKPSSLCYTIEGLADDGYYVDEVAKYRAIRFFEDIDGASVALEITSQNDNDEHALIKSFLGKRVKFTVETVD